MPVVKISDYELRELFEKQLNMFLPFSLLRFRDQLNAMKKQTSEKTSVKKKLTVFLQELILGLETEFNQQILTQWEYNEYLGMIDAVVNRILHEHAEIRKEANRMTEYRCLLSVHECYKIHMS